MKLEAPRLPVTYVDTGATLKELITALETEEVIGLDAERASGFRYSHRAYLFQIAIRGKRIYLVDPEAFEGEEWTRDLATAMASTTWILHAATQDLPCLLELGIAPTSLIDTELGARLAGLERFGLASLALSLLDIELAKEHSAADWSQRPLSKEMLNYAALDVDVLFELWDAMEATLREQGKLSWAIEEFTNLVAFKARVPVKEPWRLLPGMSKIKDLRRQKIAASLWQARNEVAKTQDVAPGRLIPDRSIAAVVNEPPATKSQLAKNKQFHGRASRSMLDLWWQAIASAGQLEIGAEERNEDHIPNHRSWEKRFPEAHSRLSTCRPLLVEKAQELSMPVENLLTPDILRRLCFEPEADCAAQLRALGAREWQIEICAPLIVAGFGQTREDSSPAPA